MKIILTIITISIVTHLIITTTFAHSVAILIYLPLAPLSMVVPALPKPAGVP